MNKFKIKRKREINLMWFVNFFKCLVFVFGTLFIIFAATGGKLLMFKHVLLYSLYSLPLCFLYACVIEKFGSFFGDMLSGWTSRRVAPREVFSADLAKAKFSKGNGRYKEALGFINNVLEKDPDHPDALYLKATLLWEGFENRSGSMAYFRKVMERVPHDHVLYRWASNYFKEIEKAK
jgi:tetratricopeptide (TPR) repeat protein